MRERDPYKVEMLLKSLKEMESDEWFSPQVVAHKEGIKPINLDMGAIKELIKYYGG